MDAVCLDDATNLIPDGTLYIVARRSRNHPYVILSCVPTKCGWEQRVIHGNDKTLFVDYVSKESRKDLADWMACDFKRNFRSFHAFEEARSYLNQKGGHLDAE